MTASTRERVVEAAREYVYARRLSIDGRKMARDARDEQDGEDSEESLALIAGAVYWRARMHQAIRRLERAVERLDA